jgi:hypothetical protein
MMVKDMDFGGKTVREILEKKLGKDAADQIVNEVNNAHQQGKRGEDLMKHFKDTLAQGGYDTSDSSFSMVIAVP